MPSLDIFNGDAFGVTQLTDSINSNPEGHAVPTAIDELFTGNERGIQTTTVFIEQQGDLINLVQSAPRGGQGQVIDKIKRTALPFSTVHLPQIGGINADEVQNIRAFGSETELQSVQNLVNLELQRMRKNLDATISYHRCKAATTGEILDADGSTLLNLYTAFGVSQQTEGFAFSVSSTKVRAAVSSAMRKAEDVIAGVSPIRGFKAFCGRAWFDAFVDHANVIKAYEGYVAAASAIGGNVRGGFSFGGVEWMEYYGKVGSDLFIDTDKAYLIPIVDGLFITRFAPADYMETVNTIGLPYYAKQELRKFGKGVDIEAQSNALNICTRPRAIIELTKS